MPSQQQQQQQQQQRQQQQQQQRQPTRERNADQIAKWHLNVTHWHCNGILKHLFVLSEMSTNSLKC